MALKAKRGELTREAIVRQALALVDKEGLAALSMRKLASRLGVEAMSLYKHVADKADLLDALSDAVMSGISDDTRSDHWRVLLQGMATRVRKALLQHPALIPLIGSGPPRSPESAAPVERARAALLAEGFSAKAATRAIHAVGAYTLGHVITESQIRTDADFRYGLEALLDGISRSKQ